MRVILLHWYGVNYIQKHEESLFPRLYICEKIAQEAEFSDRSPSILLFVLQSVHIVSWCFMTIVYTCMLTPTQIHNCSSGSESMTTHGDSDEATAQQYSLRLKKWLSFCRWHFLIKSGPILILKSGWKFLPTGPIETSAPVQIMAWRAISHYLNQWWPTYSPNDISMA